MSGIRPPVDPNVRSPAYYVARTSVRCWHCGSSTRLLALAMPHNHETLDSDADTDAVVDRVEPVSEAWQRTGVGAFLFYVEHLPDVVQDRLHQLSSHFRLAHSEVTLSSYWANHCEHCGILLGDHELHCEPDGAFVPTTETAAANIQLVQIEEAFEAVAAGYSYEPEFFRFMRKS